MARSTEATDSASITFQSKTRSVSFSFSLLMIINKDDDELGQLSIYSIDAAAPLRAQVKAALPDKKALEDSIIVIAVDLSKPWLVLECLSKWIKEVKVLFFLLFLFYEKFRSTKTSGWN